MPFIEKIGDGLNDKEDTPCRELHAIMVKIAVIASDLCIIVVDIRFDMLGEKVLFSERETRSKENDRVIILSKGRFGIRK